METNVPYVCLGVWQFHVQPDLCRAPVPAQQSLSALCPREQQRTERLWEHSWDRTTFPTQAGGDPRDKMSRGSERTSIDPQGPTGSCASCIPWALLTCCGWAGTPPQCPAAPRGWDTPGYPGTSLDLGQEPSQGTELLPAVLGRAPLPSPAPGTVFGQALKGFSFLSLIPRPACTGGSGWGPARTDTLMVYPCYTLANTYMDPNIIKPQTLHFTQHKILYSSWSFFKALL